VDWGERRKILPHGSKTWSGKGLEEKTGKAEPEGENGLLLKEETGERLPLLSKSRGNSTLFHTLPRQAKRGAGRGKTIENLSPDVGRSEGGEAIFRGRPKTAEKVELPGGNTSTRHRRFPHYGHVKNTSLKVVINQEGRTK